jgi:hypothetical protein
LLSVYWDVTNKTPEQHHGASLGGLLSKEGKQMRIILSMIVVLGLAAGFSGATFAADAPKTKADCEKAHMKWNDAAKTCTKGGM